VPRITELLIPFTNTYEELCAKRHKEYCKPEIRQVTDYLFDARRVRNRILVRRLWGYEMENQQPEESKGDNRILTRVERNVLAVLINPAYFHALDAEKCKAAGASESRFYQVKGDPWFQAQLRDAFLSFVQESVGPIIAASIDTAATSGRDGHPDRKMLLEMAQLYTPNSKIEHAGEVALRVLVDV
jgi:hypothetical protein